MATLILRYKLNAGVTPADFEKWVVETDHPAMRGLARVQRFNTYRVSGLLMGEGAPSCDYVELFEIEDLAGFTGEDMPGETVQSVMGAFMGFADAPEFLIADAINPH
jgi:REDY-like protein HapK